MTSNTSLYRRTVSWIIALVGYKSKEWKTTFHHIWLNTIVTVPRPNMRKNVKRGGPFEIFIAEIMPSHWPISQSHDQIPTSYWLWVLSESYLTNLVFEMHIVITTTSNTSLYRRTVSWIIALVGYKSKEWKTTFHYIWLNTIVTVFFFIMLF